MRGRAGPFPRVVRGGRNLVLLLLPGFMASVPILAVISLGPLAFAIREDFSLPASMIGFTYGTFFIASVAMIGPGAWLISRVRTVVVARWGLSATVLLLVGFASASSPAVILALSVGAGAANGLATPAVNVIITQLVPARSRGLSFGVKVASVPAASSLAAAGAWGTVVAVVLSGRRRARRHCAAPHLRRRTRIHLCGAETSE